MRRPNLSRPKPRWLVSNSLPSRCGAPIGLSPRGQPVRCVSPQLVQSLVVQRQRQYLTALGRRCGTAVVFLKAAWADPVLYGGRGDRSGADLDILVSPRAYLMFAAALERDGYRRYRVPTHPFTGRFEREWKFSPPGAEMDVDLHRRLAVWPWFELKTDDYLNRAILYPSCDGPILSLAPEDQVVFAATHLAGHAYALDDRHLEDMRRLIASTPIAWPLVAQRARAGYCRKPLAILAKMLRDRSDVIPECLIPSSALPRAPSSPRLQMLFFLPRMSSRRLALPLALGRYLLLRIGDFLLRANQKLAKLLAGLTGAKPLEALSGRFSRDRI
jgi:hypothetical protein